MLTCEEALERMSQALDGPLPLEERQALEEHLESCPECRAAYEAKFGPLQQTAAAEAGSYTWLQEPWPWEAAEGGKA